MEQQAASIPINFSHISSVDQNSVDASKRRSSSRSIKRRKFDDEVVEYSNVSKDPAEALLKKSHHRSRLLSQSTYYEGASSSSFSFPSPPVQKRQINSVIPGPKPCSTKKSKKSNKPPSQSSSKDLGRWKPTDDLMLITAVIQTNDLHQVYHGMKFSCKFTLQEIQQRWYALLYEPTISKLAVSAMKNLHPDVIADIECKTLFSKDEERLLASVKSSTQPSLAVFEDLLNKNSLIFHRARTPKSLMSQWQIMKQYYLLDDQRSMPGHFGKVGIPFAEFEKALQEMDLSDPPDEALEEELFLTDRREKKEIRILEEEVKRWQVLVDAVSGIAPQDFDIHTLAVLKGRLVRYLMRSREITIGRTTKDHVVDVDLQLEGPAAKVSRQQGTIRLRNSGDFFIVNEGKRPIYIDGRPILTGNKYKLNDNSVVEIAGLRFVFLINMDLISVIRQEAAKLNTPRVEP